MYAFPVKKNYLLLVLCFILMSVSCRKPIDGNDDDDKPTPVYGMKGLYILNEGLFQMNNSSISYYNAETGEMTPDIFLKVNQRGLGDTGNDLQQYGSKLYCVVNISGQIEVMNINSCISLKQISLAGKQPRKIAFYKNKAYVSCFDGSVVRIDTASLEIDATATAGANPEGICVANGKLYVANSGGLNRPNYGKTVSVFDLARFELLREIEVEINPYVMMPDKEGDVYLVSRGNYGSVPYTFQRIDSKTDKVVQRYELPVLNFTICDEYAYLYYYDFSSGKSWIKVMNILTEKIEKENFISDGTVLNTPYTIAVNPVSKDVYISNAYQFTVNSDIYVFDKNGKKKLVFEAGINSNTIVIRN